MIKVRFVTIGLALMHIVWFIFPAAATARGNRFWPGVKSWAYQLEKIDVDKIARSKADLVVIDYSSDGSDAEAFTRSDVDAMKRKPDGSRRHVVAYMSVGEAEDYRFYWRDEWKTRKPDWLDRENPDWEGNYKVRYWDARWRRIIFSYLDKIVNAGFDGVYLDIIDAFEYYEDNRPSAAREMIEFVQAIRKRAKQMKGNGDFAIIAQNGERLLEYPEYVKTIDAIAREDLFFGMDRDASRNPPGEILEARSDLDIALKNSLLVLVVEYGLDEKQREKIINHAKSKGYIPLVTVRELDRLSRAGSGQVGGPDMKSSSPGRIFRLGGVRYGFMRKGRFSFSVTSEMVVEDYKYLSTDYEPENWDWDAGDYPEKTFTADTFSEWTTSFTALYGLTNTIQAGITIPVVQRRLEKSGDDQISTLADSSGQTTLGDVVVSANYSKTWLQGDCSLLVTLDVALPTDSAADPFFTGDGEQYLNIYADRYWDIFGFIGNLGLNHFVEGDEYSLEYKAGPAMELGSGLFVSALAGGEYWVATETEPTQRNIIRLEGGLEYVLSEEMALFVSFVIDMSGDSSRRSVQLELSF